MKPESFRARNLRRHAENAFENLRRYAERIGVKDPDEAADRAARQIHGLEGAAEEPGKAARGARKSSGSARKASAAPAAAPSADEPAPVPHRLEDRTREQLYERAKELDIAGRSAMSKDELIAAIRDAQ